MSDEKKYSPDNIIPAGQWGYVDAQSLFMPRLIKNLLSNLGEKKLEYKSVGGTLTIPLEELLTQIEAAGGKLVIKKSEDSFVYNWENSYIDLDFSKKTKAVTLASYWMDPEVGALLTDIETNHVSKVKKNLIFSIVQTQSGLEARSMGDGSSPLIEGNYLPQVIEDCKYVMEAFKKDPPPGRIAILNGEPGCHQKGTKILMFDGSIKMVEDIKVGDQLMGPDSKPRNVMSLCFGHEEMIEIIPTKGDSWIVNKNHILSLVRSGSKNDGHITDVSIPNWKKWNKSNKIKHKLFRSSISFGHQKELPIDPYVIGVIIGDGSTTQSTVNVASMDNEIVEAFTNESAKFGLVVHKRKYKEKCPSYSICFDDGGKKRKNPFTKIIHELKMNVSCENKFIPTSYKLSSRKNRLKLLAGLLDSDGHLDKNGVFDFITKSTTLNDDVLFLARSLGFAAYSSKCTKSDQKGISGEYFRVCISGDLSKIPNLVLRKKAQPRKQIKNVLRTGFTTKDLPADDYYGFTLDGDGRFLLGDFTVTHNTGKTHLIRSFLTELDCIFLIIPSNLIDSMDKPNFMPLLLSVKDKHEKPIIMVIEDGDSCLVPRRGDNISMIASLLNLSDGILGSIMDIRMIISTNANIKEMDEAIMRPGRLCKRIHVGSLPYEQANQVYQRLTSNPEAQLEQRKQYTLAEIYDKLTDKKESVIPQDQPTKRVIGFHSSRTYTENVFVNKKE